MSASVTLAYPYALVAFGNAKVVLVDVETMQMVNAYRPETQDPPIAICGKPDGSAFYTLFRNGRVWTVDTDQPDSMKLAPLSYQGSISGIDIDAQGHMSLCHSIDRVVINDTSDGKTIASYYAAGDFLKNAYRYVVKPLYLVCPKPSEFYKLVAYLSTARSADVNYDIDMRDTDVNRDPWSPLWSGIGFMLVTLSLAALYFSRSDC
jgi:hypothetical protein